MYRSLRVGLYVFSFWLLWTCGYSYTMSCTRVGKDYHCAARLVSSPDVCNYPAPYGLYITRQGVYTWFTLTVQYYERPFVDDRQWCRYISILPSTAFANDDQQGLCYSVSHYAQSTSTAAIRCVVIVCTRVCFESRTVYGVCYINVCGIRTVYNVCAIEPEKQ